MYQFLGVASLDEKGMLHVPVFTNFISNHHNQLLFFGILKIHSFVLKKSFHHNQLLFFEKNRNSILHLTDLGP